MRSRIPFSQVQSNKVIHGKTLPQGFVCVRERGRERDREREREDQPESERDRRRDETKERRNVKPMEGENVKREAAEA